MQRMSEGIDIYLVRHGEASVLWSDAKATDPGLSDRGREQAASVARELAPLGSLRLISSPLRRARETAMPLGHRWDAPTRIDGRYREVPLSAETAARKAWLVDVMRARWHEVDDSIAVWRSAAWGALLALEHGAVIFTHFMLINAIVSRVTGDQRLVCCEPDYASVTHLRLGHDGSCEIISRGRGI
jgi:broad specificity phosphatase PhoE